MEVLIRFFHMAKKKVATNIPEELLEEAAELTGLNQTQALIAGLKVLIAEHKRRRLLDLRGKLHFEVDTGRTRARRRM
jgi:hypothetical protein